jgi:hypothetical protein
MTKRQSQKGQTIALVAVSMVSFIAMGALAIDLTSLYSARGEIQRAADAAVLAGAKAFLDSGVVTDPNNSTLQALATNLATAYAAVAASQNIIANGSAQLVPGFPTLDFSIPGNPRITIRLQRTSLPLFFARIWGANFASVSATAVAEAYNPAFSQSNGGSFLPSAPKCVKPLLIPNSDPGQPGHPPFVNLASGAVNSASGPFIGEQIAFKTGCNPGGGSLKGCNLPPAKGSGLQAPNAGEYLPMLVGTTHQYCHGSAAAGCSGGAGDFEQSIECCDGTAFNFPQCGTSATFASWDPTIDPRGIGQPSSPVQSGLQCLIHSTGGSTQQDSLDPSAFSSGTGPLLISPGTFSQSRYRLSSGAIIGTSDSVITVPLIDTSSGTLPDSHQVNIVGFLTLFVGDANAGNGDFNATILNVTGCGNNPSASAAVSGGGVSAIPVRLIHN